MKMTTPTEFRAHSTSVKLEEIDEAVIHTIMLRRVLAIGMSSTIAMSIAAALMGVGVIGIGNEKLMWALIAVQIVVQILVMTVNKMLWRKLDAGQPHRFLYNMFVGLKGLTASVWGLMLLPVAANLGTGLGPLLIFITLIATITISTMLTTAVWSISVAVIIGFFLTLFPQTLYFYDILGPVPIVVTLVLSPTLFWITREQSKQVRSALVNELQNERLAHHLSEALQHSDYLARHDSLTGLLNRRAFQARLEELRAERPEAAISLILLDLDHFKSINDNHGHETGDAVLISTAELINSVTRPDDLSARCDEATARWGGEEFIIALVGCPIDAAAAVSERLRARLAAREESDWPEGLSVTGSFGVALWQHDMELTSSIARADKAMYQAKVSGRNKVEVAPT